MSMFNEDIDIVESRLHTARVCPLVRSCNKKKGRGGGGISPKLMMKNGATNIYMYIF